MSQAKIISTAKSEAENATVKTSNLERLIQAGLLVIVALMPIHAFLSVWLGHMFGHQAIIQAWKDALLMILALATALLIWCEPARLQRLRQPWVLLAAGFALIAGIVTAVAHPGLTTIAFGFKTDLEFLMAGIIATTVATAPFLRRAIAAVLIGAAVVTGFGLLQIFVLPPDFLTHFGYGPHTILPYQHITQGAKSLRFPSTLGGPNQLGTYLLLPICLALAAALSKRKIQMAILAAGAVVVLIGTYSRSAWGGALIAMLITLIATAPAKLRRPLAWTSAGIGLLAVLALPAAIKPDGQLQYYILHSSVAGHSQNTSDTQHVASLLNGSREVINRPLGHGLGTAGPATFHAGATNIIENYYLQVGYETGLLGLLAFLTLVASLVYSLWRRAAMVPAALPIAATFIGISLAALLLPAWTDSSTNLIAWTIAGAVTGLRRGNEHV